MVLVDGIFFFNVVVSLGCVCGCLLWNLYFGMIIERYGGEICYVKV